jgi:arylsulfatase A-like enzyme
MHVNPQQFTFAKMNLMNKKLKRVVFGCLVTCGILFVAGSITMAAEQQVAKQQLNFVVFLVDDLGYMDVGANNPNCFYETPNIDRLAKSGMRFTDGYAANPVCSPTRYSLMTGKYPTRVAATNFFSGTRSGTFNPAPLNSNMPLDEITIAQALKAKGYATFFAGKWHLGESVEYYPQNRGFDINIGGYSKGGPYTGGKYFAPFKNPEIKIESPQGDHLPDRLARETAAFIDENKAKPFLAYLSFYSVHTPLMGRPDLVEKYKAKAAAINGDEFADEEQVFGDNPRKVRILQKHAVYAAMVEAMDQAVGKVLLQLEDSGVAENTVVIFTSDNGGLSTSEGLPTSNLPLRGGKGWVYEGGIREPWIVRYPGLTKPGSVSSVPICSIDLFPTLAAAAGVKVEHEIDGIDLRPALEGGALNRDVLYWHYPHYSNQGGFPGGAIREGDFKLVERYEDGRVHLYNLNDDIGEAHDLAEKMPDKVDVMRKHLHAWYQKVDAKFLREKAGKIPWKPERNQ